MNEPPIESRGEVPETGMTALPTRDDDAMADDTPRTDGAAQILLYARESRTLRGKTYERASLVALDLSRLRADAVQLRACNLAKSNLTHSDWLGCSLDDANMRDVDARGATLRMCTLDRADLTNSDLSGAKLENSQACAVVADGARLVDGSLVDTDLSRASLRNADLRRVDASGAVLRGADLRGAYVGNASFVDADLRGADLRGVDLADAELDGALLDGALRDEIDGTPSSSEAAEDPAGAWADLTHAAAPVVVELLRRGNRRGVVDEAALARLLGEIGHAGIPTDAAAIVDGPLAKVLDRVGAIGLGPLLGALESGGDVPPRAIAELVTTMMRDADLPDDATADDLVVHLLRQIGERTS